MNEPETEDNDDGRDPRKPMPVWMLSAILILLSFSQASADVQNAKPNARYDRMTKQELRAEVDRLDWMLTQLRETVRECYKEINRLRQAQKR